MFSKLGISLKDKYKNERVLVVGFAETATAIGVAVARVLHCDFIQTTREICNGDKFNFIEEHSHATDQRLYCTDFSDYDRILFVEDEVTTGNTILNIINLLKKRCTDIKFGAASIVNGMSEKNLLHFKQNNINVDYSEHIDNSGYSDMIENLVEFQGHKVDYTKFSSFNLNYLSISSPKYEI
jgi:adenine/guanine phosphoribosyltransferase-like PRPP-binding protein